MCNDFRSVPLKYRHHSRGIVRCMYVCMYVDGVVLRVIHAAGLCRHVAGAYCLATDYKDTRNAPNQSQSWSLAIQLAHMIYSVA